MHKIRGSVDGVKYPIVAIFIKIKAFVILLGNKAYLGIFLGQSAPYMLRNLNVSFCNKVAVTLYTHVQTKLFVKKYGIRLFDYFDNVKVVKADILDGTSFIGLPRPDIILSNPPYIRSDEIATLQTEVSFEPRLALDGGEDGLIFYRQLSEIWYPLINRGGYLAMECGEDQAEDILSLFVGKAEKGNIIKDASDLDRVVVVSR